MTRTGRRPGAPDTRQKIAIAARRAFAQRGYDATSLRTIAAEARVDPALLIHYFGSKEALFVEAVGLPGRPSEMFGDLRGVPLAQAAESIVRSYLSMIDSDESRGAVLALVRSAVSDEKAANMLREFLAAELVSSITPLTGHSDARLRASLVAAQLVGIAMLRHVVRLDALVRAGPEQIVALVGPAIERHLG